MYGGDNEKVNALVVDCSKQIFYCCKKTEIKSLCTYRQMELLTAMEDLEKSS